MSRQHIQCTYSPANISEEVVAARAERIKKVAEVRVFIVVVCRLLVDGCCEEMLSRDL